MESKDACKIDFFRPEDAQGVVDLYRAVYGNEYPVRSVYDTGEILRQDACGETYRMVARMADGTVVGHVAVYRSEPPNRSLCEVGQWMVRHDYRKHGIGAELMHAAVTTIPQDYQVDLWLESVCNHLTTQQTMAREGFIETGIEVDLMPESAYSRRGGGRVSTLLTFRRCSGRRQTLYLPLVYADFLQFVYHGADDGITLVIADTDLPADTVTKGSMKIYKEAGVARITVQAAGADFPAWVAEKEAEAAGTDIVVTEIFMPLTVPWTGAAIDVLRKRGFFIGGALFQWFGDDGLLMQKHAGTPNYEGILLFTERAKKITAFVRDDWRAVTGTRA